MSVDFATEYFNSIHNVLNNGQHPLLRNIVKDVDELGELVLLMATKRVGTHAATFDSVSTVLSLLS